MAEFDPAMAALTRSGATAGMLLEAQKRYAAQCVEDVLKKADRLIEKDGMNPERALALIYEIAAYRRIVLRQQQEATSERIPQ